MQYSKAPLDRVWKIPTRLFVYIIAAVILIVATVFTTGITLEGFILALLNAVMVSVGAYGTYEMTFKKTEK